MPSTDDTFNTMIPSTRSDPATLLEHARRLVLAHGWNATAYQIINPGIDHWFSSRGDAVIGVAAGDLA